MAGRALVLAVLLGGIVLAAARVPVEAFAAQQTFENPAVSSGGNYLAISADLGSDEHGIMVFRRAPRDVVVCGAWLVAHRMPLYGADTRPARALISALAEGADRRPEA